MKHHLIIEYTTRIISREVDNYNVINGRHPKIFEEKLNSSDYSSIFHPIYLCALHHSINEQHIFQYLKESGRIGYNIQLFYRFFKNITCLLNMSKSWGCPPSPLEVDIDRCIIQPKVFGSKQTIIFLPVLEGICS